MPHTHRYDVEDVGREGGGGEYALQEGFGWTNGVGAAMSACVRDRVSVAGQQHTPGGMRHQESGRLRTVV